MRNASRHQGLRVQVMAALSMALALATASATVPTSNELGIQFKVLRSGSPASVEIRLAPRRDFDAVTVEAASGVATLSSSCGFSQKPVIAGQAYVCRVEVTGKSSEAAMTLNVIARRAVPGAAVPVTEVHHVSVRNSGFAPGLKSATASHHDVADAAAAHK